MSTGCHILFNPILSFFFLTKSYFVLFFGKYPILSYFLAILPLILAFYSLFYHHYFMREHSLIFLASFRSASIYLLYYHNKIIWSSSNKVQSIIKTKIPFPFNLDILFKKSKNYPSLSQKQ